ncbi:MAG: transcription antitermination factor NusB [Ruminococcaceae bacterium]|nr:transcription antitermination factor NusB [Oscillospiraceae bacterium]
MKRSESRESLFILLFEASFNENPEPDKIISLSAENMGHETDEYSEKAFGEILENLENIDKEIEPFLVGRKLDRLSRMALTALRIAVYEINNACDVPAAVAINEAVELVKKYDTDNAAASYINGVLGSYVRSRA